MRSEFWWWALFSQGGLWGLHLIDLTAFPTLDYSPLALVFGTVCFIPGIAVSFRRLHDVGFRGTAAVLAIVSWFICLPLAAAATILGYNVLSILIMITSAGLLINFLLLATYKGMPVENRYGPSPFHSKDGHA